MEKHQYLRWYISIIRYTPSKYIFIIYLFNIIDIAVFFKILTKSKII
jgi:hypothetical protein